jgi:hypothetical protein
MSKTAEPTETLSEHFEANKTPRTAAARPAVGAGTSKPFGGVGLKAAASAAATPRLTGVVCVAFLGLALGGVFGLWLRARLAAASLPPRPSAQAVPFALLPASPPPTSSAASESTPESQGANTSPPADAAPPPPSEASLSAEVLAAQPSETAGVGRGEERAAVRAKDATNVGVTSPRVNEPAREGAATAAAPATKVAAPTPRAAKAAGKVAPCAIYASAVSLTLRTGSTAPLILGGPGPFTVTSPNWSDIVVFSEGRAGGGKSGWTKYAVRSVSKRAGVYTLHVKSPCDSQTIRVRVAPL